MAMYARPVADRLCQKLACGVVSPVEVTPDVLKDCLKQGWDRTLPPNDYNCQQYFALGCNTGPQRMFPDQARDAWPNSGRGAPNLYNTLIRDSAMPPQAVGMPDVIDYSVLPPNGLAPTEPIGEVQIVSRPVSMFPVDKFPSIYDSSGGRIMNDSGAYAPNALRWPWAESADYRVPPAMTMEEVEVTGNRPGPLTFLRPMPSIVPPKPPVELGSGEPGDPAAACGTFTQWVSQHPGMAVLAVLAGYLILKGTR